MAKKKAPARKQVLDADGNVIGVTDKAGNGEGSVYWHESKKRWRATYIDSKGDRRTVLGKTKDEAVARRDEKLAEMADLAAKYAQSVLGDSPTVADLCAFFIENETADIRPQTLTSYRNQIRILCTQEIEVTPGTVACFGDLPLEAFDAGRTTKLLATLRGEYAPDTVRNIRARLRQVAETGVVLGDMPYNPVTKVKAPETKKNRPKRAKRTLTPEESDRVIVAAASHPLGAAVAMLFLLGNRSSEVLGLAWQDIDLTEQWGEESWQKGVITVRRGSTYVQGQGQTLADTKTSGAQGLHYMTPTLVTLLETRRAVQDVERREAGSLWTPTTYDGEVIEPVFTNQFGGLMLSQKLYEAVQDVCVLAGVDPVGVGTHTGRRSVITRMYSKGRDIDDIARHVGHSSSKTTTGYVQSAGDRPKKTAAIAARLLDPAVPSTS